jgi:hypothetical protein
MATIDAGIFSHPRGKLSSSVWISPSTGKLYSPPPRHVDPRTALQLEYRRRMRVLGPLFRSVYRDYLKLFYPHRVANVSPYALLLGSHIRGYYEVSGVPAIKFLAFASPALWWWYLTASGPQSRLYVDWSPFVDLNFPGDCQAFIWVCYPDGRTVWNTAFLPYYPLRRQAIPFKFSMRSSLTILVYASVFRRDTTGLYLLIAEASAHFRGVVYLSL